MELKLKDFMNTYLTHASKMGRWVYVQAHQTVYCQKLERARSLVGEHLVEDSTWLIHVTSHVIIDFLRFKESQHHEEEVYVSGLSSQGEDVPEIQCKFKFTLYVLKNGDYKDIAEGQSQVDIEGTKGSVKPEELSLLADYSDQEYRHQQRDNHWNCLLDY